MSVNLDLERMKKAIAGERFELPKGLSKEGIRAYILATAKMLRERQ